jgi:hypothetical protein
MRIHPTRSIKDESICDILVGMICGTIVCICICLIFIIIILLTQSNNNSKYLSLNWIDFESGSNGF